MRKILLAFLLTTTMFSVSAKAGRVTLNCNKLDSNGCLIKEAPPTKWFAKVFEKIYQAADTDNDGCIDVDECKAFNTKQK